MATAYLSKTLSGSPTDNNKWTWSAWVKRSKLTTEQPLFYADDGGTSYYTRIQWHDTDQISVRNRFAGADKGYAITTPMYRDTASWYHLQVVLDTNNATAGDRIIIYVNGERVTAFDNNPTITQNAGSTINDGYEHRIGRGNNTSGSSYFDGNMTHVHFVDGQAYAPTVFGESDSVSGIWKPKTSPSVTYGTNGFFLKMENSGAMGTDSSGNSNTFTVSGTLTQNVDTPSNVFATLNVLASTTSQNEFQYGNLEHYGTSNWTGAVTTLGASSGKYYAEVKVTDRDNFSVGIVTLSGTAINNINTNNNGKVGKYVDSWGIEGSGSNLYKGNNGSSSSYGSGFSNNDIAMIALDVGTGSNGAVYFGKNGTWFDSGNPATGSNPAFSSLSFSDAVGFMSGLETGRVQWNFGQGYFGTTQVASANADANGHGKMEYAVPTGYYTLNTKNLKEFG